MDLGARGGSLGGPRSIFDGFWGSLGRAWGTGFRKKYVFGLEFSLHVSRMAPDIIFRRFQCPWRPLEIEKSLIFTQLSSEIKGHTHLVYGGFGMPPGSMLMSFLRPAGSSWCHWAYFF